MILDVVKVRKINKIVRDWHGIKRSDCVVNIVYIDHYLSGYSDIEVYNVDLYIDRDYISHMEYHIIDNDRIYYMKNLG